MNKYIDGINYYSSSYYYYYLPFEAAVHVHVCCTCLLSLSVSLSQQEHTEVITLEKIYIDPKYSLLKISQISCVQYFSCNSIFLPERVKFCSFNHMPKIHSGEGWRKSHTLAMTCLRIEDEPRITHTRVFPSGLIDTPTRSTNVRVSLTHMLVCKTHTM